MKKVLLIIAVIAVLAAGAGTAALVYTQISKSGVLSNNLAGNQAVPGDWIGQRGLGLREDFLHDEMMAALAEKLGITANDLEARLAKGETLAQIASSKGLTVDQFQKLMTDARNQAIDQAVKDGKLTQEQADWMKQHGFGRGLRGMRGVGPDRPGFPQRNSR